MIIGIGHKKQQGKSTLAKMLCNKYGFTEYTFAAKLKNVIDSVFDFDSYYKQHKEEICPKNNTSYRDVCESVGEFFRQKFGSDFWVKQLEKEIDWSRDIVISDVRHLEEVNFLRKKEGTLIKITNPRKIQISEGKHISEFGLDSFAGWDEQIINDGTYEKLEKNMDKILKKLRDKILE
jgi:dephospho-CoA kinase